MNVLTELNYLAVLAVVVLSQAVGALWYSPVLFGKTWAKEIGIDFDNIDKKKANRGFMFGGLISIVTSFLVAILIHMVGVDNFACGAATGLLVGLIVMTIIGTNYIYEDKSIKLFLITTCYPIVVFVVGGGILGAWR